MRRNRGYILVETVTAMAVLSIVALTVQQAVRTAVLARGLSQDYTTAQFLMERVVADCDLEPRIVAGVPHAGAFPSPDERFEYTWRLDQVEVPPPALPFSLSPDQHAALKATYVGHMGRLQVEIRWFRGGEPYAISGTTLIAPERVWIERTGMNP